MTATTAPKVDAPDSTFLGLRRFNLIMGALHLLQGILMIVLSNDTTYPVYTNFLSFNTETFSLSPDPQLVYDLRFGPAVALFLLISAVAHFYLATVGYDRYVSNLKRGMNPVRFYEYALSSSWMIVLIGMLSGIWDLGAMIALFGVNAMMNHDGTSQSEYGAHRLDGLHLRLFRRHCPLDRDRDVLRWLGDLRR